MAAEETIEDAAAEWAVRAAHADFTGHEELRRFCATSPAHAGAFAQAQAAWALLGEPDLHAEPDLHGESDPGEPSPVRGAGQGRRPVWRAALAASIAAVLVLSAYPRVTLWLKADLRTDTAETRVARLPDGSRVTMDAQSALQLAYSGQERRIVVLAGQALFEAKPAAQDGRPFVVEARGGTVTALGTRFAVNDLGDRVDVIALEHRIEIRDGAADGQVIGPGFAVRYGAGMKPARREAPAAVGEAWRRDRLLLDHVELDEAIHVLARYSDTPIRYWSSGARDRVISGAFRADDIDGAIATIAREFDLRVTRVPLLGIVLR